jgi:hypothetical protein
LQDFKLSTEEAYTELARRFFAWIGPATLDEFQKFSGLGVKASKVAVEPLKLEPLVPGDERLLMPGDRAELEAFKPLKDPHYVLVSGIDSTILLRKNLDWLLDRKDLVREVFVEKGIKSIGGLSDLPSHVILDRGRIVGLWEYDTATGSIAWMSFVKKDKALQDAIARTEQYVRDRLGDARSFSLDSPKSRMPRIDALRKAD